MPVSLIDWIPKLINKVINKPTKYVITNTEWNELWSLTFEQGNYNSETLEAVIPQLISLQNQIIDITQGSVADGSITESKIAADAISTSKIKDNNITSSKILDAAITESKLATNSVTSNKILANAITSEKIMNGSVTSDKIPDSELPATKLVLDEQGRLPVNIAGNASTASNASALSNITWDKIRLLNNYSPYGIFSVVLNEPWENGQNGIQSFYDGGSVVWYANHNATNYYKYDIATNTQATYTGPSLTVNEVVDGSTINNVSYRDCGFFKYNTNIYLVRVSNIHSGSGRYFVKILKANSNTNYFDVIATINENTGSIYSGMFYNGCFIHNNEIYINVSRAQQSNLLYRCFYKFNGTILIKHNEIYNYSTDVYKIQLTVNQNDWVYIGDNTYFHTKGVSYNVANNTITENVLNVQSYPYVVNTANYRFYENQLINSNGNIVKTYGGLPKTLHNYGNPFIYQDYLYFVLGNVLYKTYIDIY